MTDQAHALPPPAPTELAKRPLHPLVAVGLGVVAGLLLARLIRR